MMPVYTPNTQSAPCPSGTMDDGQGNCVINTGDPQPQNYYAPTPAAATAAPIPWGYIALGVVGLYLVFGGGSSAGSAS